MSMTLKPIQKREGILEAKDMVQGNVYMTAGSPRPKQYPGRMMKVDWTRKEVLLEVWYPNLQAWSEIWVPINYPVRPVRENEFMKLKASVASKDTKPATAKLTIRKTIGKTTGVGVFDTWGIAFSKHGKDPKAVVTFMKAEYPHRDTNWAKWVDGMRQRFNRGMLGIKVAEADQLEKYHTNGKAPVKKVKTLVKK